MAQCIIVFRMSSIFWTVGLFRSYMLLIFNMVWPWFFCGTVFFCPQSPCRANNISDILDFSCCPLSRVLHVTLANLWVSSEVITSCGCGWSVDHLITSLLAAPCWRDPTTSKQLSTVAIVGFRFGLYNVVTPLRFLRGTVSALHLGFLVNKWACFPKMSILLR